MKNYLRSRGSKISLALIILVAIIIVSFSTRVKHGEKLYISSMDLHLRDTTLEYNVTWNQPASEELKLTYKLFGPLESSKWAKRKSVGGVNICYAADGINIYAFLQDIIYRINLNQHTMEEVKSADINGKLTFVGRFETAPIPDKSVEGIGGVIVFLKAPDIGYGPKEPCSLN